MDIKVIKTISYESGFEEDINYEVKASGDDGKVTISIGHGQPEDMTLGRRLYDVYKIPDMLELAYNAGKNGEEFNITEEKE